MTTGGQSSRKRPTEQIAELIAALEDYAQALTKAVSLVREAGQAQGQASATSAEEKLFNLELMIQEEFLLASPLQTQRVLIEARATYTPERKRHNERMRLRAVRKRARATPESTVE